MPQAVGQGGTIRLDATYQDGAGGLVVPGTPRVDILNPSDVEVVTDAVPVNDGTGLYHYDYTVDGAAPLGVWTARWTGTINGVPVSDTDEFSVVAAGDISFDEGALVTVAEVVALANVTLDSARQTALAAKIDEWTGELETRLNRPLVVRSYTGQVVTVDSMGWAWVQGPIQTVSAVRVSGTALASTSYQARGNGILLATGYAESEVSVDYTAGIAADTPYRKAAKSILKDRAARMAVKMEDDGYGVRDLSQEGYAAPYLDEGWTDQELESVDRFRRRVVVTT